MQSSSRTSKTIFIRSNIKVKFRIKHGDGKVSDELSEEKSLSPKMACKVNWTAGITKIGSNLFSDLAFKVKIKVN